MAPGELQRSPLLRKLEITGSFTVPTKCRHLYLYRLTVKHVYYCLIFVIVLPRREVNNKELKSIAILITLIKHIMNNMYFKSLI